MNSQQKQGVHFHFKPNKPKVERMKKAGENNAKDLLPEVFSVVGSLATKANGGIDGKGFRLDRSEMTSENEV